MTTSGDDLFWDVAGELMASDDRLVEGTIMSSRCLRLVRSGKEEFLAMPHHKKSGLVVKLPKERVAALIAAGEAEEFAPAGKVFREWAAVLDHDETRWRDLLLEGISFVGDA